MPPGNICNETRARMQCKVCQAETEEFGTQKVLGAYDAHYRRCVRCQFVFVDRPTWLKESYESAIASSDTGIVVRNLRLADTTSALIDLAFGAAHRFLDFGGGAGLFVRLMRDRGFDFWLYDEYCANIFAGGFEAQPEERFDLVTCMEVVEHMVDPLAAFETLAHCAPAIVFSTELVPATRNKPGEWWYYAPETGQHVSFYTLSALRIIAGRLGLHLASNGANFHVLSQEAVGDRVVRFVSSRRGRMMARAFLRVTGRRRRSLTQTDATRMRTS